MGGVKREGVRGYGVKSRTVDMYKRGRRGRKISISSRSNACKSLGEGVRKWGQNRENNKLHTRKICVEEERQEKRKLFGLGLMYIKFYEGGRRLGSKIKREFLEFTWGKRVCVGIKKWNAITLMEGRWRGVIFECVKKLSAPNMRMRVEKFRIRDMYVRNLDLEEGEGV